jgi:hypothetical protein
MSCHFRDIPNLDTRRFAGCLFLFFVQRRRGTEAQKGFRASGLHGSISTPAKLTTATRVYNPFTSRTNGIGDPPWTTADAD